MIVDGEPLEEYNEGEDVDEVVDDDSDSDYASSSDDDDQKYVDDQKALQDLVNTSRRRYFGPNRQVTKYIPSVTDAEFMVKVSFSRSRVERLKSKALVVKLFLDGNLLKSYVWEKTDEESFMFANVIVATPDGPFKKPFLFSEIITSKHNIDFGKYQLTKLFLIGNDHSDTADVPEKNLDRVGAILIKIFRVTVGKRTRTSYKKYKGEPFRGLQAFSEVSENELKGKSLTHSAK